MDLLALQLSYDNHHSHSAHHVRTGDGVYSSFLMSYDHGLPLMDLRGNMEADTVCPSPSVCDSHVGTSGEFQALFRSIDFYINWVTWRFQSKGYLRYVFCSPNTFLVPLSSIACFPAVCTIFSFYAVGLGFDHGMVMLHGCSF